MTQPVFSIILPIYNQSDQIETIYSQYSAKLSELNDSWEIIFVINGTRDDSYYKAKKIEEKDSKVKAFILYEGGWGRAVKHGLAEASGNFLCYTNSARTSAKDLVFMLKYAKINDNIIIKANRIIRDNFVRKIGSTIYNLEFRILYRTPVWDVNGTPKVIPRKIYDNLTINSNNDLIDAEIIAKCYKNNIPYLDVPLMSTMRVSGKSTTGILSAIRMYIGLFRMRRKL